MKSSHESSTLKQTENVSDDMRRLQHTLEAYKRTLAGARRRLNECSFEKQLRSYINFINVLGTDASMRSHPLNAIPYKLRMYEFASSHGVMVPHVFAAWPRASDISLSNLPDEFVLKSDGGSSSRGVEPLRRVGSDSFERVDGSRVFSESDIKELFLADAAQGAVYGPVFAEELVKQPGNDAIPNDIKIFISYGKIMMIMIRGVGIHGSSAGITKRYVDANGEDLEGIIEGHTNDLTLPVPGDLEELIATATHLSRAVGVPFCRIDLYSSRKGVMFGEVTRAPGDFPVYLIPHDEFMGRIWLQGEAQLQMDIINGRPPGTLWGSQSNLDLYPRPQDRPDSMSARVTLPCGTWCS